MIANGIASLHNVFMIVVHFFGDKFKDKGLQLVMVAVLDMVSKRLFLLIQAIFEVGKNRTQGNYVN